MEKKDAQTAFSALGHDLRLDVFRLLIGTGSRGMPAGDIALRLAVRQNTLSANLGILQTAGLIRSERQGRSIRYFADFDGLRGLLGYLMEECCGGRRELCQPVLDEITCDVR